MTRRPSPRLRAYLVIGATGLLAGVVLGRPELVIMVTPLLLAVLVGFALTEDPGLSLTASLDRNRSIEDEEVHVVLDLSTNGSAHWLEVAISVPAGLAAPGALALLGFQLAKGEQRQLAIGLECRRWGVFRIGQLAVRARDRLGFFSYETVLDPQLSLRVYPRPEVLRRAIRPADTQVFSGNEVARWHGDGVEFADVRIYAPGDQVRRVNWRLSSQRPELHINELHPERNTDVVIFLDTFSELPGSDDTTTLVMAVRAANGIANHYLRRRDRVGVIGFGGTLRWLVPAMGLAQSYRIMDSLLDTQSVLSYAWKGIEVIPPRTLPPKALVVALSPLLDHRTVEALLDLRARGFDVAVVEIGPEGFVQPSRRAPDTVAYRLWLLQREPLRYRYQRLGVPVARWSRDQPLEAALEEVREFRRYARRALV